MPATRKGLAVVLLFAFGLLIATPWVSSPSLARTWNVPSDAGTIQAGIDSASTGDTVLVECGTYYEHGINMKTGIVLRSETGLAECVRIDAESHRCFTCYNLDSTTAIEGLTIANARVGPDSSGAGIEALYSKLDISNCDFDTCEAHSGGAIGASVAEIVATGCNFRGCVATASRGGAINSSNTPDQSGSLALLNCNFDGNASSGGGGAVRATTIEFTAAGCRFSGNSSGSYGGAAQVSQNQYPVSFTDCLFDGNSAVGSSDLGGGAIFAYQCSLYVTGCTMYSNSALIGGGSIHISNLGYAALEVDRTIIAYGGQGEPIVCGGAPPITVSCSDIYGNTTGDWVGCVAGMDSVNYNFSADPMFCSPETGDYHPRPCSPCVDSPDCGLIGALGTGDCPRLWHVPGDAPTIQAGIDTSCSGDTVLVAPGIYHESVLLKAGVYVIGEAGDPQSTVIDADGTGTPVSLFHLTETSYLEGFTLTDGAANYGGGLLCIESGPEITNCRIVDNHANVQGGGILCEQSAAPVFTDCVIAGNTSGDFGGALANYSNSNTTFANCTIHGNGAPHGGGIYTYSGSVTLLNSIMAFGTSGVAADCGPGLVSLACCDVYGNAGGDWTGGIAGQEGLNGNFSEDPWFCDAAAGDFMLGTASPCLAGSCGVVGTYGRGCFGPIPAIKGVSDIGNDQGRSVRLLWERTRFDAPGDTVDVETYEIFRRQDVYAKGLSGPIQEVSQERVGTVGAPLAAGWDYLGAVPAHGESLYQFVAPTLCDSTDAGICWTVFVVRATTPDPFTYFDSNPDSGYSIDNLAPSPPPSLVMTSPSVLAWEEVPDEDFDYYSVYGSAQPELDETATFIGCTIDLIGDVTGHIYDYYHVTATDFSGNEGEESSVSNSFARVPYLSDNDDLPSNYALRENKPNPFSTGTVVGFDLPRKGNVRINIYDTNGRLIRSLTNEFHAAGRHSVVWRGEDGHGKRVGPGLYFVRMEAGTFKDLKKIVLMR